MRKRRFRWPVVFLTFLAIVFSGHVAVAAEPTSEVLIDWQSTPTPQSITSGTALNAVVHLNRNYNEATDLPQSGGTAPLTVTVTNGVVNGIPNSCLDGSTLSTDQKTLTCVYQADALHGVATVLLIPVIASGPSGSAIRVEAEDEFGVRATTSEIPIVASDGMNIAAAKAYGMTSSSIAQQGVRTVFQIQMRKDSAVPIGSITFDAKFTVVDTQPGGSAKDYVDWSSWSFTDGRPDPVYSSLFDRSSAQNAQWSAVRDEVDPTLYHITVSNPTYLLQSATYANRKANTEGIEVLSTQRMNFPLLPSVAELDRKGSGTVTVDISNVNYTSANTGQLVSGSEADFLLTDDQVVHDYVKYGTWSGRIERIPFHRGDFNGDMTYSPDNNTAGPSNSWLGDGTVLSGQNFILNSSYGANSGPLSTCNILPQGQDAHLTGDWALEFSRFEPSGHQSFVITQQVGFGDGLPGPDGNGTVYYYTGDVNGSFYCNGLTGWTTERPADGTRITAIKIENFTYPEGYNISNFYTPAVVESQAVAGSKIWTMFARRFESPNFWANYLGAPRVPVSGGPYGIKGTSTYTDVITVGDVSPVTSIELDTTSANVGATITANVSFGNLSDGSGDSQVDGVLTVTLPPGATYIPGSSTIGEPDSINGNNVTWSRTMSSEKVENFTLQFVSSTNGGSAKVGSNWTIQAPSGQKVATATDNYVIQYIGHTILTVSPESPTFTVEKNTGSSSWTVTTQNDTTEVQGYQTTVVVLPYNGDGRGTNYSGTVKVDTVQPATKTAVYYTTVDPASIPRSPLDPLNGTPTSPNPDLWTAYTGNEDISKATGFIFLSTNVPTSTVLNHRIDFTYTTDGSMSAVGAEFHISGISAATSTILKTVEAASSTTSGAPSPVQVEKHFLDGVSGEPGLTVSFTGELRLPESGNGAHNIVVSDLGGNGLTDIRFTEVSVGSVEGSVWTVAPYLPPGSVATFSGTAVVALDYDRSTQLVNKVVASTDESPKDGSGVCEDNGSAADDTDACDMATTSFNWSFNAAVSGSTSPVCAYGGESTVEYEVSLSNDGSLTGLAPDVRSSFGGGTVKSVKVDGVEVQPTDGSYTIFSGRRLAPGETVNTTVEVAFTSVSGPLTNQLTLDGETILTDNTASVDSEPCVIPVGGGFPNSGGSQVVVLGFGGLLATALLLTLPRLRKQRA